MPASHETLTRTRAGGGPARWAFATVVTLIVHGAAFFALSVPVPDIAITSAPEARVVWAGASPMGTGSLLSEQLLLFDNAPLFLPTEWNSATAENVTATGRAPGEIFEAYEPRLSMPAAQSPAMLELLPEGVASAREGVQRFDWNLFSAFGQVDKPAVVLEDRLAAIEVRSLETRKLVLEVPVPRSTAPEAGSWPDWTPFEMLAAVESAGVQAPPLVVQRGSGSGVVDAFFRSFVLRDLQLDLRLEPGYYRITVGP